MVTYKFNEKFVPLLTWIHFCAK